MAKKTQSVLLGLAVKVLALTVIQGQNKFTVPVEPIDIPEYFHGDYNYMVNSVKYDIIIDQNSWGESMKVSMRYTHKVTNSFAEGRNVTFLMQDRDSSQDCYRCLDVWYRTPDMFQVKSTDCLIVVNPLEDFAKTCPGIFSFSSVESDYTVYRRNPEPTDIPVYYWGDYYYQQGGLDNGVIVNRELWGTLRVIVRYTHRLVAPFAEGRNITFLMKESDPQSNCYHCVDVLYRTPNILQVKTSECYTVTDPANQFKKICSGVTTLPTVDSVYTMYRKAPVNVNCIATFEGLYHFTYEINWGGGGICDTPNSVIQACQEPGSQYVDNQVFTINFAKCPDVFTSKNDRIRYQCYGSWYAQVSADVGYTYAAIADTVEKDNREKFKCLLTKKNQKSADNTIRWVMSRFSDCTELSSMYDGPVRLKLRRIPPPTPYSTPSCSLPRNITGTWFTQGVQYKSNIRVNETHFYFYTIRNEFEYEEIYYSCQQSLGTRYLMTKVVVGKCEVDFVCFDIAPRHHSIVRYRIGKPSRLTVGELANPDFKTKKYKYTCDWTTLTFSRDNADWKYEVLIMDPPSPIPCPVGGRYSFDQKAYVENEKFQTRIRGVTEVPRVQVQCKKWVTEFKSCSQDSSKIEVDAQYCESVDYMGKPIGEYDEPDRIMTCVGYWMEDFKSYLITYDEEDAISNYRCWVYKRTTWTSVVMSRSQTARCNKRQEAESFIVEGTGLSIILQESERLFDNCPLHYDAGEDSWKLPNTLYVLNRSSYISCSFTSVVLLISFILLL